MAFVCVGGPQPRDGKVGVDARDVLDRLRLEVEDVCVLARFEILRTPPAAPSSIRKVWSRSLPSRSRAAKPNSSAAIAAISSAVNRGGGASSTLSVATGRDYASVSSASYRSTPCGSWIMLPPSTTTDWPVT